MTILPVATAVGSALVAGTYAAFSVMVMPALSRQKDADAAATMQEINRRAERGPFIILFAGTTLAAAGLAISSLRSGEGAPIPLGAAVLSLASTAITVLANVPMNRRLDREGSAYWQSYRRSWTAWNSLRGLTAAAAVALLAIPRH